MPWSPPRRTCRNLWSLHESCVPLQFQIVVPSGFRNANIAPRSTRVQRSQSDAPSFHTGALLKCNPGGLKCGQILDRSGNVAFVRCHSEPIPHGGMNTARYRQGARFQPSIIRTANDNGSVQIAKTYKVSVVCVDTFLFIIGSNDHSHIGASSVEPDVSVQGVVPPVTRAGQQLG